MPSKSESLNRPPPLDLSLNCSSILHYIAAHPSCLILIARDMVIPIQMLSCFHLPPGLHIVCYLRKNTCEEDISVSSIYVAFHNKLRGHIGRIIWHLCVCH
jgi:hypothetical protein